MERDRQGSIEIHTMCGAPYLSQAFSITSTPIGLHDLSGAQADEETMAPGAASSSKGCPVPVRACKALLFQVATRTEFGPQILCGGIEEMSHSPRGTVLSGE